MQKDADGVSLQTKAPVHPKCAISQTMKSQRSISNELQYKAKQGLILFQKNYNHIFIIYLFVCDKGIAIPQTKFASIWPLNNRFGLFLASFQHCLAFIGIFIWQPWYP